MRTCVRPAGVKKTTQIAHQRGEAASPCTLRCVFRVLRNIFLINRQIYSNPFNETASIPCSRSISCRPTASPSPAAVWTKIETVRSSDKAGVAGPPPVALVILLCGAMRFFASRFCSFSPLPGSSCSEELILVLFVVPEPRP